MAFRKGSRFSPYPKSLRHTVARFRHNKTRLLEKTAIKLARLTGIPKDAWLHPEYVFNPENPCVWKGEWPPPTDHLSFWGKRWAQLLIETFPNKKPTQKQFTKWVNGPRKVLDYEFFAKGGQL